MEQIEYFIKNSSGEYQPVHFLTDANIVNVNDAGNYYSSSNVENVLQEVGLSLADIVKQEEYPNGYRIRNYQNNIGKTLEDFETYTDWTFLGTGCEIAGNTTEVRRGKKSLKFTTALGTGGTMTKTIRKYFANTNKRLRLWVYCHGNPAVVFGSLSLYLASDPAFTKFFQINLTSQIKNEGWNAIDVHPFDTWNNTGGESWESIFVRMRFTINPKAGQTCSLSFDAMDYGIENTSRVIFTFDDGLADTFSKAYPIMSNAGIKGVTYAIANNVGTSDYMDLDKLHEIYDAGWDVGNHSFDHVSFEGKTIQEVQESIVKGQSYLLDNGFMRSARHFAIPYGTFNTDVATAISNSGVITARTSFEGSFYADVVSPLKLPSRVFVNTTTFEEAIGWLNNAIERGETIILMFHGIADTPTDEYQWATVDFQTLVNYLVVKNVPVVTMSEWYAELNV